MSVDTWTPHTADDYASGFNQLLPSGPAWPRDRTSVLQMVVAGLAEIWGSPVDTSAALLLTQESDPRSTVILLSDWERAWGLPDDCVDEGQSIADRQAALVQKYTLLGAQSREFFINVANQLGYQIDTIREWSPFMAGVSRCGDTRNLDDNVHYRWEIGPPEMRFYWSISVGVLKDTWFRASSGQAGVDPMLRIGIASELECLIRRWAPAHTVVTFDYSALSDLDFSQAYNSAYTTLLMA